MTVGIVGTGPAVDAVEAAIEEVDVPVETGNVDLVGDVEYAVVVGLAGSDGFRRANELAIEAGIPWIAVEIGGIGGVPVDDIDATVSALDPDVACFECLRSRVHSVGPEETAEPTADRSAVRVAGAHAGQLTVRAIAGENVAGTVLEVPYARRELLAVPHCRCASETSTSIDREVVTRSLDESAARAERAIDDRIGLVTQIGEQASFPAPYYLATLADTTVFSDGAAPERAAGVDSDWDRAFVKALGEGLERYSAAIYREDGFRFDTIEGVDGVSPDSFVRPDDAVDPEPTDELPWVEGVDLSTDETVFLPAEFVHFPPPVETYTTPITTGLGLGNDTVEALLSGLYEVVERDATMIGWYSTFDPLELVVNDDRFDTLSRRARSEDLTVTPLLMTQDVDVPVVTVAVHREEWPSFAVGSAADLNGEKAATDALAEAIQNWMELRNMGRDRAADAEGAIGRYADYPREVRSFTETSGRVDAASVGTDVSLSGTDELDTLLDRVEAADLPAFAASLTPRDVAAIGFETVRVLVPGSQPLFVSDPFFGERARTVPRDLGYEPRLDRPFHPYP
ncbi:YcaO-like family protein [Halanaeroarchaeum sulfurireducens]|uniref:YcaO-like family domain-containing protein n=1 Tax=Halanaeroarchaeum sulfurireducens TaxID=1604004 RepID=A0A0F7PEW8_9EURY|nr:YcaO-like family protein [Halanaeroarchaeum sulfurireducens]AKH97873.1 YcaO-like family domain-containing protein [Halanaeroarchaeum sulfurireducens]ALG82267.1 YcaO-like family domain-containing protein [Halanaeroarchaeum sulfurireducens]